MHKTLLALLAPLAVAFFAVAASPPASAQTLSQNQLEDLADDAEDAADDLDDDFKEGLEETPLAGSARAQELGEAMENLEDLLDQLEERTDDGARAEELQPLVERLIRIAEEIDPVIRQYRFSEDVQGDWDTVRTTLDSFAAHSGSVSRVGSPQAPAAPEAPAAPGVSAPARRSPRPERERARQRTPAPAGLSSSVEEAERLSNLFEDDFAQDLRNSSLQPTHEAEQLRGEARTLEETLNALKSAYGEGNNSEVRRLAEQALAVSTSINRAVLETRFSAPVEINWAKIRRNLNALARHYGFETLPTRY